MKDLTRDRLSIVLMFLLLSTTINLSGGSIELCLVSMINLWLMSFYVFIIDCQTKSEKKDKHTIFGILFFGFVFQIFLLKSISIFIIQLISVFVEIQWELLFMSLYTVLAYVLFNVFTFVASLRFANNISKLKTIIV